MTKFPDTSETLIAKVCDPDDRQAWERFEQLYRPVIYRIARSRGMQHSDALDLVQQVLMSVAGAINDYEKRGDGPSFRKWIGRVTRNAILKAFTRGPLEKASGGTAILHSLHEVASTHHPIESMIETEYQRELYSTAASKVQKDVSEVIWLAFEMTMLQGQSVDQAAATLGLAVGSVYAARSRVMRRLRDQVKRLEDDCET